MLLFEDAEVFGRGAELRYAQRGDEFGHGESAVWIEGRAVVEDQSCAGSEAGYEPVPHHPGGCCKVE